MDQIKENVPYTKDQSFDAALSAVVGSNTCAGGGAIDLELPSALPAIHPFADPKNIGLICGLVNGVFTPNLRVLLANVLGAIDASIPNKDQNKAVKHIVRTAFDAAYYDVLARAYPDTTFGHDGGYAVLPEPDKSKAFDQSLILK